MKKNLPEERRPYSSPHGEAPVSETGADGRSVGAKAAFEAGSGLSQKGMASQPSKMACPTDAPSVVFADLWARLKAGSSQADLANTYAKGNLVGAESHLSPVRPQGESVGDMPVQTNPVDDESRAIAFICDQLSKTGGGPWSPRLGGVYKAVLLGLFSQSRFVSVAWRIGWCSLVGVLPSIAIMLALGDGAQSMMLDAAIVAAGAFLSLVLLHLEVVVPVRRAVAVVRAVTR
ncbi:MAG: hypothetical protein KC561_16300 [Myxococcales bacterium]|nr:hypothetical protein [Myxococcales bacterium]